MKSLVNNPRYAPSNGHVRVLYLTLLLFCSPALTAQYSADVSCQDFDLSVFDSSCLDSLSKINVQYDDHVYQAEYTDVTSSPECVWKDFKGHFDIDLWKFHADNYDGKLHQLEAPHAIKIEGASHSPTNNHHRYVASLKIEAPTSGYVAFDWSSQGGDFPHIDAFYFTVNDSCVQLSNLQTTEGHFVSWHLEKGDIISLEQTSNGTYNHITTTISRWKFIPDIYQVIDRYWRFVDADQNEKVCKQHIEITRPALEAFMIPANRDRYDAPALSCEEDISPTPYDFPHYSGLKKKTFLSSEPQNDFSASHEDFLISKCGGNKTIKRLWKIKDHCTEASIERTQILKIVDDSTIEIKCPKDQTFHINKCEVSVYIRQPRAWSSCNENIHVDIEWAYGNGSKIYSGVTPGRYEIKFTARDGCGKEEVCSMWLNLVYNNTNDIVCKENQEYTLPSSGQLRLEATDLIDGESSCSELKVEIDGLPYLNLNCADLGWNTYTITYYHVAYPDDIKTCTVEINLLGPDENIICKNNLSLDLPSSGALRIYVADLVDVESSICTDLIFEINGKAYLDLDCSDLGWNSYEITFYNPSQPSKIQTCIIEIQLNGDTDVVHCKSSLNYTLPASGTLVIPVGDLIEVQPSVCSNLIFEVEGKSSLTLDCENIGATSVRIKYYDPTDPYNFQTCTTIINLSGDHGSVECKTNLEYTLPISGTMRIPVDDLVNIHSTVCTNLVLEVEGGSYLELSCADIGAQSYVIKYYNPITPEDLETCTVTITLYGNSLGNLICPNDVSIKCGTDITDLSVFGNVSASDIDPAAISYQEHRQLNECGIGEIIRTWSTDAYCGGIQSCSQVIKIHDDLSDINIQWPNNYYLEGCAGSQNLVPEYLPTEFAFPRVYSQSSCGEITFDFSDTNSGSDHCFVIQRLWVAYNSCDASWIRSHTQNVEVKDIDKPVLSIPNDILIESGSASCNGAYVSIPLVTAQDCDSDIVIINNSIYADQNNADASGTYPSGLTTVTYTATDKCGNQSTGSLNINVEAVGAPDLTCIGEFDVFLATDAYDKIGYTLTADQLITSSSTSCDGTSFIYAFSQDIDSTTLEIGCADIGLKGIEVFRFDGYAWTSCTAWVRTSDPSDHCSPDASFASISGKVTTEEGEAVKYVEVLMDGFEGGSTDNNGEYLIGNIPTGLSHSIQPKKEINIRNGINTLDMVLLNRHLLGTRFITSPYKLIACDLNNSNSVSVGDLYLMNGLVIATINELERSWKFIPEDWIFPDPTDPFADPFPESIDMQINGDMSNQNFIGIKSGDPNHSADPKKLMGLQEGDGQIALKIKDQRFLKDLKVEVSLQPQLQKHLEGMQFTLEFDPEMLAFDQIVASFGLNENLVINRSRIDFGEIGVVFVNYQQLSEIPALKLNFTALKDGNISTTIKISSLLYQSEGYFRDEVVPVHLEFEQNIEGQLDILAMPNPFKNVLNLSIYSPEFQRGTLTIMDITGRHITQHIIELDQGDNTHTINEKDFENAGIYLLQLHTGSAVQQLKVVMID